MRWSATHEITGPSTAIVPRTPSSPRIHGEVLKLRWVSRRWKPTVTPSPIGMYMTRKIAMSRQCSSRSHSCQPTSTSSSGGTRGDHARDRAVERSRAPGSLDLLRRRALARLPGCRASPEEPRPAALSPGALPAAPRRRSYTTNADAAQSAIFTVAGHRDGGLLSPGQDGGDSPTGTARRQAASVARQPARTSSTTLPVARRSSIASSASAALLQREALADDRRGWRPRRPCGSTAAPISRLRSGLPIT